MYEQESDIEIFYLPLTGTPAPQVKWLENGRELQTEFNDFSYPSRASSKLVIKNLSRMHQHAIFTCQASNFPGKVVSANLTIELHCELKIHVQFSVYSSLFSLLQPCKKINNI